MGSSADDREGALCTMDKRLNGIRRGKESHGSSMNAKAAGGVKLSAASVLVQDEPVDDDTDAIQAFSARARVANGNPSNEVESLRAENRSLRRALEDAQRQLQLLSTADAGSKNKTRSSLSREPGNGGVAFAQMRRLLLKDKTFLHRQLLSFLNIEDLGRCVLQYMVMS